MSSYLAVFHVSPDAEELYRRILRSGPTMLAPHAAELGWPLGHATAALESLINARLVRETADGKVLVEHPRPALERLLGNEEAKLDTRRRELVEARVAIARFTAEHRALGASGGPTAAKPAWELVSSQMAVSMVEHTLRSTTGLIRNSVLSLQVGPGLDEEGARRHPAALANGREQRALYALEALEALEDSAARRWVRAMADAGEQQRVSASPPSEFTIFGSDVVLAMADWGSVESDHIVIRNPMLIAAFTTMFDYAWDLGHPMPGDRRDIAQDRQLMTLLASGFKDEAIARYLGCGVRTVRRRVAQMMDELGAESRFQLGAVAQRRGLLKPTADHPQVDGGAR